MEKIAIFQKFYSKVKLSTQTRRIRPLGGFYDKNSSLRLNLKSRQFEGGKGAFLECKIM